MVIALVITMVIGITVDLTGREIGDSIHIQDIALPAGATPTTDRNFVIANIAAPSALVSADNDADDAEAPANSRLSAIKEILDRTVGKGVMLGEEQDKAPIEIVFRVVDEAANSA